LGYLRVKPPEGKAAITSQIIAATIEVGLIKPDETVGGSRKYARYVPFWAPAHLRETPRWGMKIEKQAKYQRVLI
jgi:hypothetical protein